MIRDPSTDGVSLALGVAAGLVVTAAAWEWLDTCVMRPEEGIVEAATRCAKTGQWGYGSGQRGRR